MHLVFFKFQREKNSIHARDTIHTNIPNKALETINIYVNKSGLRPLCRQIKKSTIYFVQISKISTLYTMYRNLARKHMLSNTTTLHQY